MNKNCKGYKSLLKSVKKDCENEGCFNPHGCDKERYRYEGGYCYSNTKCTHSYCDKFKWVIERAEHYANKTGLKAEDILNSWEERRGYWYMNFYQECNQPEIKGDKVKTFETRDEFKKSLENKGFRCPKCGEESSSYKECSNKKCDWCSYGLFGTMGKGITVFIKETYGMAEIFMPIAWETKANKGDTKDER